MTITVKLGKKLEEEVRRRSVEQELTVSEYIRRAVGEKLEREPPKETPYEAWQRVFTGDWTSGHGTGDEAERSEEVLREILDAKRRRLEKGNRRR